MIRRARPRRISDREAREIEKDHPMGGPVPTRGLCRSCGDWVDEAEGRLHAHDCPDAPEEKRRAS
jgi:hypothetical protein